MAQKFNIKYISIFIDKILPNWIDEKYPKYRKFIYHFLRFIEQDDQQYELIYNFIKFIDIDKINNLSDEDNKELILNEIYKQMVGDANARYLSTLLDEILYLKKQKTFLNQKGTKNSFLFYLLLLLQNSYFRIENVGGHSKQHDGTWKHNGTITYANGENYIEPFIYLVISDRNLSDYEKVLKSLNPAGMQYYTNIQKDFFDSEGDKYILGFKQNNSGTWLTEVS